MIVTTHDIKGKLTIYKYNRNGKLVDHRIAHNSITTSGRQLVADLFKFNILDSSEDKIQRISAIHLGKSNKPFKADQNAMKDYVGQTTIDLIKYVPTGDDRVKLHLEGVLDADNCNDKLQEAGLFTSDDPPIMYNRVIFDTITKSPEFKLTLIWELTF